MRRLLLRVPRLSNGQAGHLLLTPLEGLGEVLRVHIIGWRGFLVIERARRVLKLIFSNFLLILILGRSGLILLSSRIIVLVLREGRSGLALL